MPYTIELPSDTPPQKTGKYTIVPPSAQSGGPGPSAGGQPPSVPGAQASPPAPGGDAAREAPGRLQAVWDGLLHGIGNVGTGIRGLAARSPLSRLTGDTAESADAARIKRQQDYLGPFAPGPGRPLTPARAHPFYAGAGEMGGEALVTAPLAALPGGAEAALAGRVAPMAARIGGSALAGGLGGAAQPASGPDYWKQKAIQTWFGAGIGGALGATGNVASPTMSPEARSLAQAGVRLTPGMRAGGTVQSMERSLQVFPIVRGYVYGNVGRSLEDFNRAAVRQALDPIGAVVPNSIRAGHDLMSYATQQFDNAYNRILPNLRLTQSGTANVIQNNQPLQHLLSELPPDLQNRFTTILQNRVLSRFDPTTGEMSGRVWKNVESYLGKRAASYSGTNDHELGEALNQLQGVLRGELANQNPQFAADLTRINQGYAMFTRLRDASTRRSAGGGTFTPADLLASAKTMDPSVGHGDFARGDALMQVLGESAQKTLSGSFANRADRLRWDDILTGAMFTPLYLGARAAQAVPGLGRGLEAASPAMGGTAADLIQKEPPPPKVGDRGPNGGRILAVQPDVGRP